MNAPDRWIVLKFGGTSVSRRERWDTIGRIARERAGRVGHSAAGDQHLQPLTRKRRHRVGQRTIEPPARGRVRYARRNDGNPPIH